MTDPVSPHRDIRGSFSTDRPVAVLMVFLAAIVFGFFSYERLPVTLMPELSYPTLTVRTEYPGAAPEEVENDVSRPIEDALGVVGGLTRASSISRAGASDVVLEFSWDTDMSEAIQDTLEKLDLVFLPDEAERPLILRFDPSLDPVLELSLAAPEAGDEEDLRRLRRIAELQVRRALEPIEGVAAVRLRGGLEEEIHVLLDEAELRRTGLGPNEVVTRLAQENVNVAGGTIQEGRTEYRVRTLNEYQSLEQIRETVVARRGDREIRLADLATVRWAHEEREIVTRAGGAESVQIDLYKEADANMVAMANRVRQRIGELDIAAAERRSEKAQTVDPKAGKKRKFGPSKGRSGGRRGQKTTLADELWLAERVELRVVADRSVFIESSISEVQQTAIFGGLLAIAVLYLFLRNLKSTAIVAVAIPISLLVTFAPLNLLGVSLNIMSLGGLALGIGMLVDSSIVVLESIYRCREEGDGVRAAAIRGTREVRGAVIASTLTSIAVFFPMVFVEGVAGQAFADLGLAVVISLIASLWVAISFIPMLASRRAPLDDRATRAANATTAARDPNADDEETVVVEPGHPARRRGFAALRRARIDWRRGGRWLARSPLLRFVPWLVLVLWLAIRAPIALFFEILGKALFGLIGGIAWLGSRLLRLLRPVAGFVVRPLLALTGRLLDLVQRTYRSLLGSALRAPGVVVALTLALFALTAWLGQALESELLPEVRQGELTVEVALPVGTPLEETDALLAPVERAILAERGAIRRLLVTVGYDAENTQRSDEGEHTARFKVLLDSSDPGQEERVIESLRRRFAALPDVEARVVRPVLFSFRTPIEIEIQGDDLDRLRTTANQVVERLQAMPELADVETTLRAGAPEMQIVYDRDRLAAYDLDVASVAEQVRDQVQGIEATRYNLIDRRVPIVVRLAEDDRASVDDVRALVVNPSGDRPIALDAVSQVTLGEGPSEVRRIDGQRVALVRANLGDASLGAAVEAIEAELLGMEWPADMTYFLGGQNQEWERSRGSLTLALVLSIFLVYVIMAAQFESLLQPLVIMATIPLAFLGSFLILHAAAISLSIVVFLGMIMLAGIVVNNAIVLVDYTNELRARGLELRDAVIEAGTVRLRPILMTTATTVLGLAPMALGLGDGAEIRRPMALAVIGGMLTSTILTLVVIPTVYELVERGRATLLRRRPQATSDEAREATATPAGGTA